MKKLMFVVVSLGLAFGSTACKKDEKKGDEAAKKVEGDGKGTAAKPDPGTGTGAVAASKDPAPTEQPPPPAADGFKLAWKPMAVGLKEEANDQVTTKMTITAQPGQNIDITMLKSEQVHAEVLEVNAEGVPTKKKVHYAKLEESQTMGGQTQTEPSPIAGKAYVIWVEGDAFKATSGDGKEVSPEELAKLEDDQKKELGQIPGIAQVLFSKTWKQGEKVTLTPDDLKTLTLGSKEKVVPSSAVVTFAGVEGGVATFDFDVVAAMDDGESKMDTPMKMQIKVDVANVRPTALSMTGTLTGKVKGMDAVGTVEGTRTFTYQ